MSTNTVNLSLLIGVVLFIIEIAFFNGGVLWAGAFFGFLLYIGWKRYSSLWGKVFFWIGLIGLIIAILNMIAVRFLIIVFVVLLLIDYLKSTKEPKHIEPVLYLDDTLNVEREPLIKTEPLLKQVFYGNERTNQHAYEWNDINIQGGIGDRIIDLNNTVLPNDTAVISIRHFVGNITIYIPYETEFMIHHSAVFGRAYILNEKHHQLMNQILSYKTENFDTSIPRVKIITSIISGNVEVKRI